MSVAGFVTAAVPFVARDRKAIAATLHIGKRAQAREKIAHIVDRPTMFVTSLVENVVEDFTDLMILISMKRDRF